MHEEIVEMAGLRAVSIGDPAKADFVCVLLHGFQMSPTDLAPFAHSLGLPGWFLFPEGPLEAQPTGRAWWRIDATAREEALARGPRDFAPQHPPDLPLARENLASFVDIIEPTRGGRPLVLGGFSQGGMLTCDTLLRTVRADAMVLLSASRIAFDEWSEPLSSGRVRGLPVLVSHGEADRDLSFNAGVALRDCLIGGGADVTWVPFPEGHEIPLVVWRKLRKFLRPYLAH